MIVVGNIYSGLSSSGGGGGVMTLNNGLTLIGTNGQLGGALVQNTIVDTTSAFTLFLGDNTNSTAFVYIDSAASQASIGAQNIAGTISGMLQINTGAGLVLTFIPVSGRIQQLSMNGSGGIIIQDDSDLLGLVGFADYSPAAKLNPLAYPQYGALSAFLTGTLNADVNIDSGVHNLIISGSGFANQIPSFQLTNSAGSADVRLEIFGLSNETAQVVANGAGGVNMSTVIGITNHTSHQKRMIIDETVLSGFQIFDDIDNLGFAGQADFSAAVLAYPGGLAYPQLKTVNSLISAGSGAPIVGTTNLRLQTTSQTVLLYTVDATHNRLLRVSANMFNNSLPVGAVQLQLRYTDETGTVQTVSLSTSSLIGVIVSPDQIIYAQKNTAVQLLVTLGTSANYNLYATAEYLNVQN